MHFKKAIIPIFTILYCTSTLAISIGSLLKENRDFSALEYRILSHVERPTLSGVISGDYFTAFETGNLDQVTGRDFFIELDSSLQRMIGKHEVNSVIIGRDNCLLRGEHDCYDSDYAIGNDFSSPEYDQLQQMKEIVDGYGGTLYYMNIYPRETYLWDKYIYPQKDNILLSHKENEARLRFYEHNGINCIDTYPVFETHPGEYLFFNTDHHYTFKGAYYSYRELLSAINASGSSSTHLEIPDWDDMPKTVAEGAFSGRLSGMLGDLRFDGKDYLEYALPDDYPETYERFETGERSSLPIIREEGAPEYGFFMNGDNGNTVIKTFREDRPSILIIGYSYTDALEVLAVYDFNEMHSIDPRHYSGDILAYIAENRIDNVVVQGECRIDEQGN